MVALVIALVLLVVGAGLLPPTPTKSPQVPFWCGDACESELHGSCEYSAADASRADQLGEG